MVKQVSLKSMRDGQKHYHSSNSCQSLISSDKHHHYHRLDNALHHTNTTNAVHKSSKINNKTKRSPIGKVFNRFVQSIAQVNDSGTFDVSLEIKSIQTVSPRGKGKMKADTNAKANAQLMHHVQQIIEMKSETVSDSLPSTPKPSSSSPYLYRKAKEVYQNFLCNSNGNSNSSSRESSPRLNKTYDNVLVVCDRTDELFANGEFQRTRSQRSSSRSLKLLQFFSNKKLPQQQQQQQQQDNSPRSSDANSPVLMRAHSLNNANEKCNEIDTEHFNSQNDSDSLNDSSFEMQSPLIPIFKITPAKMDAGNRARSSAIEFTHFLRSSFHAKRAYVTRLRRSLSEQECYHHNTSNTINERQPAKNGKGYSTHKNYERHAFANVTNNITNCVNDRITNLRKSDSTDLPFYRPLQSQSIERIWYNRLKDTSMTTTATTTTTTTTTTIITKSNNNNNNNNNSIINNNNNNVSHEYQLDREKSFVRPSKNDTNAVLSWATSLECLLADIGGLKAFAAFLKFEYSAENVYFWIACERLRYEENDTERARLARIIYKRHLDDGACEAVNVDSKARHFNDNQLEHAPIDIFQSAQKQVFNLMKFDSYPRFIRSDLYKKCLQAAEKGQPLPGTDDDSFDDILKINTNNINNNNNIMNTASKLKKSASNAEDRRRKSLLPWHRKTRSKSRERIDDVKRAGVKNAIDGACPNHLLPSKIPIIAGSSIKALTNPRHNSVSTVYDSRSSLSSCDVLPIISLDAACSLCRIKFTDDGATTMVQTKPTETIGQLVERLLEKRGIRYRSYDAIVKEYNKSIDLNAPTQEIAGKEVEIEQRIAFKLHLPDPKVISVKSKPKKYLFEVVKPILGKYNYDMKMVEVLYKETQSKVDLLQLVTTVDGQRLQIILRNSLAEDYQNDNITKKFKTSEAMKNVTNIAAAISQQAAMTVVGRRQTSSNSLTSSSYSASNLSKTLPNERSPKLSEADSLSKSDDCDSEASSVFEKVVNKTDSMNHTPIGLIVKSKIQKYQQQQQQYGVNSIIMDESITEKKPLIAKLKAGVKVQVTERLSDSQDGVTGEVIRKAPLARMEDQRIADVKTEWNNSIENNATGTTENMSECLRKARNNLNPINKRYPGTATGTPFTNSTISSLDRHKAKPNDVILRSNSNNEQMVGNDFKNPPPLPPKPKVLPIKPSNWGINPNINLSKISSIPNTPPPTPTMPNAPTSY